MCSKSFDAASKTATAVAGCGAANREDERNCAPQDVTTTETAPPA